MGGRAGSLRRMREQAGSAQERVARRGTISVRQHAGSRSSPQVRVAVPGHDFSAAACRIALISASAGGSAGARFQCETVRNRMKRLKDEYRRNNIRT